MSTKLMEQQIAELHQRVEKPEGHVKPLAKSAWREAFGAMQDDELSREAARIGAGWRARENERRSGLIESHPLRRS